jgi:hypothetical protein
MAGGDRTGMLFQIPEALVNIAHFPKLIGAREKETISRWGGRRDRLV